MSSAGSLSEDTTQSIAFLNSEQALEILNFDAYWPKWNAPWWHMLLLHEMGLTKEIPAQIVDAYVEALNRMPLKIFPIHPDELPEGTDPFRGTSCHCQLGNAYQVLAEWGIDVDARLPWIRPWFLKYQMADGGFNCDNDAYLVKDECPSSMVGTIAAFESILRYTPRTWTKQEQDFLARGADFLSRRQLRHGSTTQYNAEERESEGKWLKLCFPRFYLYDVLRGLHALVDWSEKTGNPLKPEAISGVVDHLNREFPDGQVRIGRTAYDGLTTLLQNPSGEWQRRQPATMFPLLREVSVVGAVSPVLSTQWMQVKEKIKARGLM